MIMMVLSRVLIVLVMVSVVCQSQADSTTETMRFDTMQPTTERPTTACSYTFENADCYGHDIWSGRISYAQCSDACTKRSDCKSFQYYRGISCYLKNFVCSKSQLSNVGRQKYAQYTKHCSVDTDSGCGSPRHQTGLIGTISSMNYPNNYQHLADCKWVITVPSRFRIRIHFDSYFGIERDPHCRYDSVSLYEGTSSTVPIGVFCGSSAPGTFVADDNVITVSFKSDSTVNDTGFLLKWDATLHEATNATDTIELASTAIADADATTETMRFDTMQPTTERPTTATNCPSVPQINNAVADTNFTNVGTVVNYKCKKGYSQKGAISSIRCDTKATWSKTDMACGKYVNIAYAKPSFLSSTYMIHKGESWRAVDGNRSPLIFHDWSCAHSKDEYQPWLAVDLGQEYQVMRMIVVNRAEHQGYRLKQFDFFIGKDHPKLHQNAVRQADVCYSQNSSASDGQTFDVDCKNMTGRYIGVRINTKGILQICEIEAYVIKVEENVANGKPTLMSSNYSQGAESSLAVDGKWFPSLSYSCAVTQPDPVPWLAVDIGQNIKVKTVVVVNVAGGFGQMLRDFDIFVTTSQPPGGLSSMYICYNHSGPADDGEIFRKDCNGAVGRYVGVKNGPQTSLQICEVEVYIEESTNCPSVPQINNAVADTNFTNVGAVVNYKCKKGYSQKGAISSIRCDTKATWSKTDMACGKYVNIAYAKPSFLSSTYPDGESWRGVDGNRSALIFRDWSCAHSKDEYQPWLAVDLGKEYQVMRMIVVNRAESQGYRLKEFDFFIGKDHPKLHPNAVRQADVCYSQNSSASDGQTFDVDCKNMTGRYIGVRINTKGILQICEIEAYVIKVEENVANGKPTLMSSNYSRGPESSLAVDGKWFPCCDSCAVTQPDPVPWWTVDIGKNIKVKTVVVVNGVDLFGQMLRDFDIFVTTSQPPGGLSSMYSCYNHSGPADDGEIFRKDCNGAVGRYVGVKNGPQTSLQICEVEVYIEECKCKVNK